MKNIILEFIAISSKQYLSIEKVFCDYFKIYGGFISLVSSPYLHLSFVLSLLSFGIWSDKDWWDIPISVLPGLISFTLAGYAMLTALGNDQFRAKMANAVTENKESALMQVSSSFAHFIVVQTIGLLLALTAKAHIFKSLYPHVNLLTKNFLTSDFFITIHNLFWWFSYFIFLYSCVLIFPCAISIFRATRWFNKFMQKTEENTKKPHESEIFDHSNQNRQPPK